MSKILTLSTPRTSRDPWVRLMTANTANSTLAPPAPTRVEPKDFGAARYTIHTGRFPLARFIFAGTDAENEDFQYQIIGWAKYGRVDGDPFWLGRILAKGIATLGTLTAGTAGADIEGSGTLWADTITETIGITGSQVFSEANDGIAWLEIDCSNCEYLEIQTDRDAGISTSATTDALVQLGERATGINDVDITADVGNVGVLSAGTGSPITLPTALGAGGVGGTVQRVVLPTDGVMGTALGAVGVAAAAAGVIHAQLRAIADAAITTEANIATLIANYPTLDWANAVYTKIDQTGAAGVTALTAGAGGGEYVYLMSLFGLIAVGGTVTIQDEDGTTLTGPMPTGANGGFSVGGAGFPVLRTSVVAKDLAINTSEKFYGHAVCIVQ